MVDVVGNEASAADVRVWRSFGPYVAVAVLALTLCVLALFVVRDRRSPAYPPHSPQRALATYLKLLQDGHVDRAYAMTDFDPGPEGVITRAEYHQQWDNWSTSSHRVTLAQVTRSGDVSSVTVEVTSFSAGEFGPSEQTARVTFTLALRHGSWRVTGPAYAYLP